MTSKKDYEEIAKIIRENRTFVYENTVWMETLVEQLSDYFKNDNPLFDKVKFRKACFHITE